MQVHHGSLINNFVNYKGGAAVKTEGGRQMIVSKNVLDFARKRFSCPTLPGVLTENGGGSGTASIAHWEHSVYYVRFLLLSLQQMQMLLDVAGIGM